MISAKIASIKNFNLSSREQEILKHIIKGYSNPKIAQILSISESTVKAHLGKIYEKLGVANRIEAVVLVITKKIL